MSRRRQGILLFKGIHRDVWHVEESQRMPSDIKEFRGGCGTTFNFRFAEHQYVEEEVAALPTNTCALCYKYVTGNKKPVV